MGTSPFFRLQFLRKCKLLPFRLGDMCTERMKGNCEVGQVVLTPQVSKTRTNEKCTSLLTDRCLQFKSCFRVVAEPEKATP